MVKVLFVCLGNICRSPLAEASFNDLVKKSKLNDYLWADSAGTAGYHIGKNADHRSIKVAANHGIIIDHKVEKITKEHLDAFDHIVVMDEQNFEDVHTMYYEVKGFPPSADKLFLIRDFDPEVRGVQNVHDPYFDGENVFEEVFEILERSNVKLIEHLVDKHNIEVPIDEVEE